MDDATERQFKDAPDSRQGHHHIRASLVDGDRACREDWGKAGENAAEANSVSTYRREGHLCGHAFVAKAPWGLRKSALPMHPNLGGKLVLDVYSESLALFSFDKRARGLSVH